MESWPTLKTKIEKKANASRDDKSTHPLNIFTFISQIFTIAKDPGKKKSNQNYTFPPDPSKSGVKAAGTWPGSMRTEAPKEQKHMNAK